LLFGWALLRGERWPTIREWRSAVLLGLVLFAGDYGSLFWAEKHVASGIAAVISALIPVEIALFESARSKRIPAKLLILGTACGVIGVVLLSLAHMSEGGVQLGAMAALLLGTLCWSAGTMWTRALPLPAAKTVSAGIQMIFGGLWLGIIGAALGEASRLSMAEVTTKTITAMAYLIIAASILAFTAYVWLLGHDSPTRVASYAYVNPVIAVILGSVFAGEKLTVQTVAGTALVLAGVVAVLRSKSAAPVRTASATEHSS
jgi:drug/metabolite transporter (DMT)-like permease